MKVTAIRGREPLLIGLFAIVLIIGGLILWREDVKANQRTTADITAAQKATMLTIDESVGLTIGPASLYSAFHFIRIEHEKLRAVGIRLHRVNMQEQAMDIYNTCMKDQDTQHCYLEYNIVRQWPDVH